MIVMIRSGLRPDDVGEPCIGTQRPEDAAQKKAARARRLLERVIIATHADRRTLLGNEGSEIDGIADRVLAQPTGKPTTDLTAAVRAERRDSANRGGQVLTRLPLNGVLDVRQFERQGAV